MRQARQLRLAARRRPARNRGSPAASRTVERVEIFRHSAAGLAQCRDVAAQRRHAERKRLDQRKAEAFGEGRQQQRPRPPYQTRHLGVGHRRSMTMPRRPESSMSTTFSVSQPRCPTSTSRGAALGFSGEPAPQIEQQQVVLARLDRADIDEIRRFGRPPGCRRSGRVAPNGATRTGGRARRDRDAAAARRGSPPN